MTKGVCHERPRKADRGPLVTRRVAPVDYQIKNDRIVDLYIFVSAVYNPNTPIWMRVW